MTKKYFSFLVLLMISGSLLAACNKNEEPAATPSTPSEEQEYQEEPAAEADDSLMAGTWTLNSEKSKLSYSASKVVGTPHTGTVAVKEGGMVIDETGVKSGEFVMDMTTITDSENNEMYLKHVRGEDFFAVETYPEAKFVIKSVTYVQGTDQGAEYKVTGDLTIRDKTNEVTFDATYLEGAEALQVKAEFPIDRTKWDIKFNSSSFVQNLGDNAIKDEIEFKLDLYFALAQ